MGRLGFNLVRHKEVSKNVEAGVVAADQQNERNENVEIGELILAIEERNRKIKNLKILAGILNAVIIFLSAYILLTQSRVFRSDQAEAAEVQDLLDQTLQMEALKGEYDVLQALNQEQQRNCTAEESARVKLEQELITEHSLREADILESRRRYEALHASFETLQVKHEDLGNQCQIAQEELKTELRKLGDERADLERKLTEANRRLDRRSTQSRQAKVTVPTTTTAAPTTPAPTTTTTKRPGLFDSERFQKINDLVKDIETGAAIFDLREFMKKTDEVFRF